MAKKDKGNAPKVEVKDQQQQKQQQTGTNNAASKTAESVMNPSDHLDANHRVELLGIATEIFKKDPKAAEHTGFSQEAVNTINKITATMTVQSLAMEAIVCKENFTMMLPVDQLKEIEAVCAERGIGIKFDTKMLPAPDENGIVKVPSKALTMDKETKKAAVEEATIVEELPELDPSKINSDEALRKALIYTLADTKTNARPYDRLNAAIDLFKSYLYFHESDEKKKEEISKAERANLLHDMIVKVGSCPFSINGFAKILYNSVATTKTPIEAFCMFRNASVTKDGSLKDKNNVPDIDDATVALFVKNVVTWTAESQIEEVKLCIEGVKQGIEILKKNKKQNKTAIEKEEAKIKDYEATIEAHKDVISLVSSPSSDIADTFKEAFVDKEHEGFKNARRTCSNILKTYFPQIESYKEIKEESLLHNIQQYIGVIVNFFRGPGEQLPTYKEAYITDFEMKEKESEEEKKDEKPAEEESKK